MLPFGVENKSNNNDTTHTLDALCVPYKVKKFQVAEKTQRLWFMRLVSEHNRKIVSTPENCK